MPYASPPAIATHLPVVSVPVNTDHAPVPTEYTGPLVASTSAARSVPAGITATSMPAGVTHSSVASGSCLPSAMTHNPVCTMPQVRLPKLNMKKFNGDLTRWSTFWDSFASSVHSNPSLSNIDKFNYLISLLESSAAEAIAGLTPTDANYREAVSTLQRRFGNPQMIINRHMEALLNVPGVISHQDTKALRKLHDTVEAHVRGLKALKVPAQTYGTLLTSVLINKLPPELRLIVTREMRGLTWDLERLMMAFGQELDARERVFTPSSAGGNRRSQPRLPTAAALIADSSGPSGNRPTCVYCGKDHASSACTTVTNAAARKESLRRDRRCFVCLKRHHLSKDCRSSFNCKKCRGRHHTSICTRASGRPSKGPPPNRESKDPLPGDGKPSSDVLRKAEVPQSTSSFCAGTRTQILLQTARLRLTNARGDAMTARALFDSGSQRTYVSRQLRERLQLPTMNTERMQIKTFGSAESSEPREAKCSR